MQTQARAETAVKLLRACMAADDQAGTDFLASVIDREQLYLHIDDAGQPITSMAQFVDGMNGDEDEASYSRPYNSLTVLAAAANNRRILAIVAAQQEMFATMREPR